MTYRIIATLVLIACIVAAGVALEFQEPSASQSPAPAGTYTPSTDDGAMQSLRIP